MTASLMSRWLTIAAFVLPIMTMPTRGEAQDIKTFYSGKTLRILVGLPPGGGADAYARLVQRHFGRHLPGLPAVVAQNMPGAGTLRSVMALNSSPEDGTVLAHFSSALLTEAITAPDKVKLDFRSFGWLGNVSEDVRVCYVRSATGIQKWQDMVASALVVFGATAPGTAGNVDTAMLRNLFGTIAPSLAHVRNGKMRAFATTGERRNAMLPDARGGSGSSYGSHRRWCRAWIAISPGVAIWCATPMNDRSTISWWRRSGLAVCLWWRDACQRSGLRCCGQPSMPWWPTLNSEPTPKR